MEHEHTWSIGKHWERNSMDLEDDLFVFKSLWFCECGYWKTVRHQVETYWNDEQPNALEGESR